MLLLFLARLLLAFLFDLLCAAFDRLMRGLHLVDVDAVMGWVIHCTLHDEQAGAVAIGNHMVDTLQSTHAGFISQGTGGVPAFLFGTKALLRAELLEAVVGLSINSRAKMKWAILLR